MLDSKIRFIAIKQNIDILGAKGIPSKVMITMFSLFAELERDLISERTKKALAARKAAGIILGRPKGSRGKNKLDDKNEEIVRLLSQDTSKLSVAKICGVTRSTLIYYIHTRGLNKFLHD